MKAPVMQMLQPAVIHARPDAAVAALEPRAHPVNGLVVLRGDALVMPVRREVKQSVAIMVEPQATVAVFMRAHRAARSRAEQAAPLRNVPRPRPARHFAEPGAVQPPQR